MSNMNTLEGIYTAILNTGWLIVDETNKYVHRNMSQVTGEKTEPFIMLDKQVALPTRENLNNSGKKNLLIFHPLLEGLMGGESPVIGKLRRAYSIRFTYAGTSLFSLLLSGSSHISEVSKFSPDQMELLKAVGEVDETTIKTWSKIVKTSIEKFGPSNYFTDVYISSNVTIGSETYSRFASTRFPIYDELVKNGDKFFDASFQIKKSDRKIFIKLFEFMFPSIGIKDSYSFGTNSRIAPYLDALLKTFGKLFSITNKIYDDFNSVIEMEENIKTPIDWLPITEDIERLKNLAQSVPQQYGNYPIRVEDEKRNATGSSAQPVINKVAQPTQSVPLQQNQPVNAYTPPVQQQVEVTQPTKQKFVGLGAPIDGANGVIFEKENNLQANIINSSAARAIFDPRQALANAVNEVSRHGGVGRVNATDVNPSALQANVIFNNNQQQLQNNNGWNNNFNSFTGNMYQPNAAAMAREMALVRIMSDPSPFAQSNMLGRGSAI